jgi:hypothetical protein
LDATGGNGVTLAVEEMRGWFYHRPISHCCRTRGGDVDVLGVLLPGIVDAVEVAFASSV